MIIPPNTIYRFNVTPIKLPMAFFTELEQKFSQFIWKYKKCQNSEHILEKEEWSWRNQPSWLQIILQSYSHQDSMSTSRHKNQNIDQWNKIESPEINPCIYAAAAKLLQSCLTLCDPIGSSPPGSPIPGFIQARTLEWFAISSSNAWKWKVKGKSLSRVLLLAIPWTAAYQAPPSMEFSRQEYWSGLPLPSPCTYGYLIFDKGGKNIQWGKDSLFNKWFWENWTATCKRMKFEHFLTPYTKNKLKMG